MLSTVKVVLTFVRFLRLFKSANSTLDRPIKLVIESGANGWELIEYQEICGSACEYLGNDSVVKVVVDDRRYYLRTLRKSLRSANPTHYFYDPRTGCQGNWRSIWQSLAVAIILQWNRAVPIAWLTDLPVRRWRMQCFVVTAHCGVTVTLMSPRLVCDLFPHPRLAGPSLMAISTDRVINLGLLRALQPKVDKARAVFSGSLYEPRTTILNEIQEIVHKQGHQFEILARTLTEVRVGNEDYWLRLAQADILVSNADQIAGPGIDDTGMPHLIFRYSEALAAGALLIAPRVPGIERYLIPGKHFVSFNSIADAAEKICFYLENEEERLKIARAGNEQIASLTNSHAYWNAIDSALGTESISI